MKECWINVYLYPNGKIYYGTDVPDIGTSKSIAKQAISNGVKQLYRIHVRMK